MSREEGEMESSERDNTALDQPRDTTTRTTEVLDALREGTIGDSVVDTAKQIAVARHKSGSAVVRIEAPEIGKSAAPVEHAHTSVEYMHGPHRPSQRPCWVAAPWWVARSRRARADTRAHD